MKQAETQGRLITDEECRGTPFTVSGICLRYNLCRLHACDVILCHCPPNDRASVLAYIAEERKVKE